MGCAVSEGTKILTLHSCYHPLKNLQNMLMNQQNTFQILCAPKIYDSKSLFCTLHPGLLGSRLTMTFIPASQVLDPSSVHSMMQK